MRTTNSGVILMTEKYWRSSQLSIARLYGRVKMNNATYWVVNKEGKDLYQCSAEAKKAGKEMAIEAGEPADLVHEKFLPYYRKLGRDRFIEILKANQGKTNDELIKIYKNEIKKGNSKYGR